MPKKIVHYESLTQEFAATKDWKRVDLPDGYRYVRTNPFYRAWSWFLYYVVAIPLAFLVLKVGTLYRVKGKKKLRSARKKGGLFLYMNHTAILADVAIPLVSVGFPRRVRIICNREAVSKPVIRSIVSCLAGLPLPGEDVRQGKDFMDAVEHFIGKGEDILVFPEAHIWPRCTFIRPFAPHAFVYPARMGRPVLAAVTTYKKRKVLRFLPPTPVIHLGGPFLPDMSLPLSERTRLLEEEVRSFMEEKAASLDNYESIEYVPMEKISEASSSTSCSGDPIIEATTRRPESK